ncbi:XrtA/PEP-CTERM system TPR-repeat protein PrsT [Siccirubricoccus sp. G192]|uniref:XrtA/PEP-CTERM system TPR-repeat protein PrsT n=1 Tax=Siccirubricoccus sp. G192 TaxID=2849651 RepID=UPI001C2C4DD1|nr:XrtA/PEP-CTERM system TPR-repeat protein PrsT [Siccirubricoccus sp. G192]MBV1800006.1 PEP-CTERM system TPR-repeat protein PrsT [Siccirubricoccus sp. G192]
MAKPLLPFYALGRAAGRVPVLALTAALAAASLAAPPAALAGPLERAQEAQARGDLRAAQIEFRNAVRAEPNSGAARAALASASLDLGDMDAAEKEARAALDRGYDRAAGTALLLRAYLGQRRFQELLRDFPAPEGQPPTPAQAAVAGQVAAARAITQMLLSQPEDAERSVADALRLAPSAVEPQLAAAALAVSKGDRAAAEAATDRALALDPNSAEALLRKASLQLEGGDRQAAEESLGRVIARMPGNVVARLRRAEVMLQLGDTARAKQDVDAALTSQPGSVPGIYLRALLLARAQDWRGVDETLQRIGPMLANFPDGFLLQATAKRAIGQTAQAEDAARRHFARRPEDPRGARLLATLEFEGGRPDAARETLRRLDARGAADAEALDMLGRLYGLAGRRREALDALQRAAALAPENPGILTRLAAARLAAGDAAGTTATAHSALEHGAAQPGVREMLAAAAMVQGDLAAAAEELGRLDPNAKRSEPAGVLEGTLHLVHLDQAGARTAFEAVLRDYPESVGARLGLARLASMRGDPAEAERLMAEVLQRQPGNAEAINRLAAAATSGGPRAAPARATLEAAQAAAPGEPLLALAFANVLVRSGDAARAVTVLDAEALEARSRGPALHLARAEVRAAAGQWAEAEAASRAALAEDPDSSGARRQLAALLTRNGDARAAEAVVQEGLRRKPGDAILQQTLVGLTLQAQGLDAALAVADRLAQQPEAQPAAATLRGDLLLNARRPEEAARAFAAANAAAPSSVLAMRQATAWMAAQKPAEAAAALSARLEREPADLAALNMLAQYDLQAGRLAEAERRLTDLVARSPTNGVALNNLAWVLAQRGGPDTAKARGFAERAYFLIPGAEAADTLGWILARGGEAKLAVPLLRQAVATPRAAQTPDPAMSYRLAYALHAAGEREEALRVLDPVLAGGTAFPERPEAERLLADLRAGR